MESNYMQVGKAIECNNCHPEKGYMSCEFIFKEHGIKCKCICHTPPQENKDIEAKIREALRWPKEIDMLSLDGDSRGSIGRVVALFEDLLAEERRHLIERLEGRIKKLDKDYEYVSDGTVGGNIHEEHIRGKKFGYLTAREDFLNLLVKEKNI